MWTLQDKTDEKVPDTTQNDMGLRTRCGNRHIMMYGILDEDDS